MELLNPTALWLLLLPLIVLLLPRRQSARVRRMVGNLYMWAQPVTRDPLAVAARRLRRNWLLFLQVAFMLAVASAAVRPALLWRPTEVALIVDVSASMGALDGEVTRLDRARTAAREALASVPRFARVRLVAAGGAPSDLGEFARDDAALSRAIDALRPTGASADLAGAVRDARIAGGSGQIVIIATDQPPQTTGERTTWLTVGHQAGNVAITNLAARRLPAAPDEGEILATLHNFGPANAIVDLDISQDDARIEQRHATIAAGSTAVVSARVLRLGQKLRARILTPDALAIDNERFAVVAPRTPTRVLLVGNDSGFLARALSAHPDLSVDGSTASAEPHDVVVCDPCATIPDGSRGVLLVSTAGELSDAATLTISSPDHPLALTLDASQTVTSTFVGPTPPEEADVVFRAGGAPAIIAYERDGRRSVELRANTNDTRLVLSPVFPALIDSIVGWLARRDEAASAVLAGQTAMVTPGIYNVDGGSVLAVNAVIAGESNLSSSAPAALPVNTASLGTIEPAGRELTTLLAICALVLLAVEWRYLRPAGRPRYIRLATAILLALAAGGTRLPVRDARAAVVYVLDRSDSISPRAQQSALVQINAWAATMRAGDTAGVVAFGAEPVLERPPVERLRVPEITSAIVGSETNLEAALSVARAVLPARGSRRIVLMSDGRATTGDLRRETSRLASEGIPVDVVPPAHDAARERVVATRVEAPANVRVNDSLVLSIAFTGRPGGKGQLTVTRDGQPFASLAVQVPPTGIGSLSFSDEFREGGLHGYQATIRDEVDDQDAAASAGPAAGAMIAVEAPPTVLYVASTQPTVSGLLSSAGFRVSHASPGAIPTSARALVRYDAIVLDDVISSSLQPAQLAAVKDYVERDGGGLLLLGSPRSLEAGGYAAGPLGSILPIDFRPRTGKRAPSMAFVLIFDKSGSMSDLAAGVPKIELARQSVIKVLEIVPASDPLGIIAFDAAPAVVAPLSRSRDAGSIARRLQELSPGGSTAIAPAMQVAAGWLRDAGPVERRHILLISDGRSSPADAQRVRDTVSRQNIEVSVVAIGADADRRTLEELAHATGGRAFFPRDLSELPQIVAREAARAAGGATVDEPFTLRLMPHPIVAGIAGAGLPQLGGYVVGAPRLGSETPLVSHLDDPVLATTRAGLGKVAVYTADLGSAWSTQLRSWSGASGLWIRTVRWLSRSIDTPGLSARLDERADGARLVVSAWRPDTTFASDLSVQAEVSAPDGTRETLTLEPVAPGRYEVPVHVGMTGAYTVAISARERTGVERRMLRGFYWSSDRERRARGADLRTLTSIAEHTGGRVLGDGDSPFNAPRPREPVNVSPWLAGAALLLFFGEITLGALRAAGPGAWWRRRHARAAEGVQAA